LIVPGITPSTEDPYAAWAASYPPRAHNPLMEVEQAAVIELLPPVQGARVLDAGCGTGRYCDVLAAAGAARVVGLDRSPAMLRRAARATCRLRADLARLPLADASFDLVLSGLVLPDVPELTPVLGEWARVLRPGGLVICSTLHPRGRELGWTRTFDTATGAQALPAFWHTLQDLGTAFNALGLRIEAFSEPCLDARHQVGPRLPVALVVRARRRHL
jgi:malonyl-CoA O-methyltransferase